MKKVARRTMILGRNWMEKVTRWWTREVFSWFCECLLSALGQEYLGSYPDDVVFGGEGSPDGGHTEERDLDEGRQEYLGGGKYEGKDEKSGGEK